MVSRRARPAPGAVTEKYPAWNQRFWEHLGIAIQQNGIRRVIVMEHRDAGAYKLILGGELEVEMPLDRRLRGRQLVTRTWRQSPSSGADTVAHA